MTLFKTLFTTLLEGHSTVSVTDSVITSDSIFEIYTDNNTVVMESVVVTDTTALITFDSNATEDIAVAVWINNLNGGYEPFSGDYNDLTNRPTIPVIEVDPILTEGEPIADININGTNYEIYAPEGETVIANPTLAGDEAALEGLQVGNTKYSVASSNVELLTDFFVMENNYSYSAITSTIVKIGKAIIGNVNISKTSGNFDVGSANSFASINPLYLPLVNRFRTAGILSTNGYSASNNNGYVSINTSTNKLEIWSTTLGMNNIRFQFVCIME